MPIRSILARPSTRSSSPSPLSPSASSESLLSLDTKPQRKQSIYPETRLVQRHLSSYNSSSAIPIVTEQLYSTSFIAIFAFITGALVSFIAVSYFSTVASTSTTSTSPSVLPGHGSSYWQRVGDTIEWVSAGLPQSWGQYDYFVDDNIFWTYNRNTKQGPENWGKLRDLTSPTSDLLFPFCDTTRIDAQQSPINIISTDVEDSVVDSISNLERHFESQQFEIIAWPAPGNQPSPGFQVHPIFGNATWIVDGKVFSLWQFHYHAPSEHLIDGIRFPLEAHFVYRHFGFNDEIEFAVFGILYPFDVLDASNPFLEPWWKHIYHEGKVGAGEINLEGMVNDIASTTMSSSSDSNNVGIPTYFRYNGSLTTPPCLEGINWHVAKSAHGISFKQHRAYANALKLIDNHRDIQPLNGRTVRRHEKR